MAAEARRSRPTKPEAEAERDVDATRASGVIPAQAGIQFVHVNDQQLLRYSRHILLDELGLEGAGALRAAHALVIGVGGLGRPAAQFLVAAGVGTLTLCDADAVDLTNLQRQILYATADVGAPQGRRRRAALAAINPEVRIEPLAAAGRRGATARRWCARPTSCSTAATTSRRGTRSIAPACAPRKPLVSGAAIRFDGQVAVFDLRQRSAPCYHCLFGEGGELEETRCATMGVFAPLVGIVGAMQAAEALKLLAGVGETLAGRLLLVDARLAQWRSVRVPRDPACAVCAAPANPGG